MLLLVPGFKQLNFHPLISKIRKQWNLSLPRYSAYCDPLPIFRALWRQPLDWTSVTNVRQRLILLWRFLGLFRSVDLQRTLRVISLHRGHCYISVRRKNAPLHSFEQGMCLPDPSISPQHVLMHYVALTSSVVPAGAHLICWLRPPFAALSSNTMSSITREGLRALGVDVSNYGPHSTRGAFMEFFKSLQLDSEVVAAIGKWKNLEAFNKHDLRLIAAGIASAAAEAGVLATRTYADFLQRFNPY